MAPASISSSLPSARTRRAVFGASFSSARMALPVLSRARNSSTWPSRTSTVTTAAASKYTGTDPSAPRNPAGKMPGASVATTLNPKAAPVPSAISVNMFKCPDRTEAQPR